MRPSAVLRVSSVSLAMAAVICGAPVAAQQPGSAAALQTVVVTATRTPVKVSDVVAEVTVLDRATLDRSEGRTLVEVLSQAPGLQFTANGGLGKSSSLFVRGLEARHVLLLIDGVRVGSATLNTPSLDNVPLDTVERIEIVRGPMTSLYGSNAMGGVVQVFTRKGQPGLRGNARLTGGSHRYGLASGGVSFGTENFDLAAQVQHQQTQGFSATGPRVPFNNFNPDEDGFRQNAGSVRAGWTFAPGWRVEGLWLDSKGTTQIDDGPVADARAGLRNSVQSVQLNGAVLQGWRTQLALGRSLDVYDTLSSASAFSALGAIETKQTQLSWENRLALPLGEALVVLERIRQDVARPGAPFAVKERSIDALALGWSANVNAHDVQASLRRDRNSQFGSTTTGALAYAYKFTEAWRAGGAYGTSFTAPSFNQLYFPGFGNPNLQPEEGEHRELFLQWVAGLQQWRATAYDHRYDLFISSGPQSSNVPKVKISGATLAWDARLDAWALAASYDHVNPKNNSVGTANFGKQLPRRAKQALKASADWQRGAYSIGASMQAYSARFDNTSNTIQLGGYGVLDLRANWAFMPDWSAGLRLNNVAGQSYETALGYNQPGREAFITLRWNPR